MSSPAAGSVVSSTSRSRVSRSGRFAVAPPDELDRHRPAGVPGGEDGGVTRQLVVRLGARLELHDEDPVGLREADGDDTPEASQRQLELVDVHGLAGSSARPVVVAS